MTMSGQENTTILFFIKRTKLLKNGEAPIFIRITINKCKIWIKTDTHSVLTRTGIPEQHGHPFRWQADSHSVLMWTLFSSFLSH